MTDVLPPVHLRTSHRVQPLPVLPGKPKSSAAKKYAALSAEIADVRQHERLLHGAASDAHHALVRTGPALERAEAAAAVARELGNDPGDALTQAQEDHAAAVETAATFADAQARLDAFADHREHLESVQRSILDANFLAIVAELQAETIAPAVAAALAAITEARTAVEELQACGHALQGFTQAADGLQYEDVRAPSLHSTLRALELAADDLVAPQLYIRWRDWSGYDLDGLPAPLAQVRVALSQGAIEGERAGRPFPEPEHMQEAVA